jgi:hypothetical protein
MSKLSLHVMHIGKTGGTAIKAALRGREDEGRYHIILHDHGRTLRDIPAGHKIFFCVRDPIDRFVSAFYSRLRKGLPRHFREWTPAERWAFTTYATPDALARALGGPTALRGAALAAMKTIQHIGDRYADTFGSLAALRARLDDVLYIGFQDTLDTDFAHLLTLLDLPPEIHLPDDDVQAHRNPRNIDRTLTAEAIECLVGHYRQDVAFVAACRNWRYSLLADRFGSMDVTTQGQTTEAQSDGADAGAALARGALG